MNQPAPFRHILIIEDQKARRIVALEEAIYSLGRASSNTIIIYDRVVSRHHATLLQVRTSPRLDSFSYRIIDGDLEGNRSTNGLIINGVRTTARLLQHGDTIYFGSQSKASYYILSDSLHIALFNPEEYAASDNSPEARVAAEDYSRSTLIVPEQLESLSQEELIRLASFPELSPNPIIEISFQGTITYSNPAANLKFDNLQKLGLDHPVLTGLLSEVQNLQGNLLLREIEVAQAIFEQYVHYITESKVIRSYLFDVTERKRAEAELQYRAMYDPLTKLPNRSTFNEQLALAIANAQRYQHRMAVLFLDLDSFKHINDTLGHSAGDRLLQTFAQYLSASLRAGDLVARWGGDEFTVLLPQISNAEDTISLTQRIFKHLKQPVFIAGTQLYLKSSIGIAIYPQDGEDGESLLKNADAALYRAKEQGRNCYQFYSKTMTSKASVLLKLETLLQQALEQDRFSLDYQPQFKLDTRKISSMEAFLHCHQAELGQIAPNKLLSLAEKTELIVPLTQWMLRTACEQNYTWQRILPEALPVVVNISPRQFRQAHVVSLVKQVLEETNLAPHLLQIEIPETTLMQNWSFVRQGIEDLRQLGVQLSMDDFGTGYSSLSYLKELPFQVLKIAPSFVQSLQDNPRDTAIISAVIGVGRSFHLTVVAEGVETPQQLDLLKRLECEEVQGNLLSHALNAQEATQFLVLNT
jgi:diguanylate cyclase (GGDEF)-like protein